MSRLSDSQLTLTQVVRADEVDLTAKETDELISTQLPSPRAMGPPPPRKTVPEPELSVAEAWPLSPIAINCGGFQTHRKRERSDTTFVTEQDATPLVSRDKLNGAKLLNVCRQLRADNNLLVERQGVLRYDLECANVRVEVLEADLREVRKEKASLQALLHCMDSKCVDVHQEFIALVSLACFYSYPLH